MIHSHHYRDEGAVSLKKLLLIREYKQLMLPLCHAHLGLVQHDNPNFLFCSLIPPCPSSQCNRLVYAITRFLLLLHISRKYTFLSETHCNSRSPQRHYTFTYTFSSWVINTFLFLRENVGAKPVLLLLFFFLSRYLFVPVLGQSLFQFVCVHKVTHKKIGILKQNLLFVAKKSRLYLASRIQNVGFQFLCQGRLKTRYFGYVVNI